MLRRAFALRRPARSLATAAASPPAQSAATATTARPLRVTFVNKDGSTVQTTAAAGENLLQVAHRHAVDLEGACDGACACSTCHIILDETVYDALPPPSEAEEDMLDLAFGLTETSRLGCQVVLGPEHDGIRVQLPAATRNMYVDGHKPKPH